MGDITTGFEIGPSPATASAFGSFMYSITCTLCQGGKAANPAGPLLFTVTSISGVNESSFVPNSGGYYFASDIVGTNGNTGNVASFKGSAPTVPEPVSMVLIGVGLFAIGALKIGRKPKPVA